MAARTYKRDSHGRFASGSGGSGGGGRKASSGSKRKAPATTSARGRALTNQRRATEAVRAGRGGKGPSAKAVRSAVTAMRARAYYASTGTGTKRSAKKAVSAAAKGKAIRAEARAKRKVAGERAAARPKARVVAKPRATASQYSRIRGAIDPGSTRKVLQSRAQVLRQASTATGSQRRTLLGIAGRQAEGLSVSGNAPNRIGRGNNQLTRAGKRAAANYVRIERALANTPAGASRKKLQRRLDVAFAALASLPKTRLPR